MPGVPPGVARVAPGVVRLVHPFPSILASVVTAAIAAAAHGDPATVARLGLAMLGIQFAIGATNDLVDAERDRTAKPAKPIPAGAVSRGLAGVVAVLALVGGLALAWTVGPLVLVLAAAGASAGLAYDLWLKGTSVSWLPYTLGIPLLPLFAWLGASGSIPSQILVAAGLAIPAGAALALANEIPDVERDARTGVMSAARRLGRERAWVVGASLQTVVGVGVVISYVAFDGRRDRLPVLLTNVAVLAIGVSLGREDAVDRRQRGWEVQAVAIGLLAAVWLTGVPRII